MSIAKDVENLDWPVECPECKSTINIKLKQVKREEIITCTTCKTKIQLRDQENSSREALKPFEELDDTIDKFGK